MPRIRPPPPPSVRPPSADNVPPVPPPPSVVITTPKNENKFLASNFSIFSGLNSIVGEDEEEGLENTCVPTNTCETQIDGSGIAGLNSMESILDYDILPEAERSPGFIRSEMEAFIPVGGLVAPERKRQEFHDFLHKKGFISAIAKALITLYDQPELPPKDEAIDHIAKNMGFNLSMQAELAESKSYCHMLKVRIQRLQTENDWMRRHLDNYEETETPLDTVDPSDLPPIQYLKLELRHRKHRHRSKKRSSGDTDHEQQEQVHHDEAASQENK